MEDFMKSVHRANTFALWIMIIFILGSFALSFILSLLPFSIDSTLVSLLRYILLFGVPILFYFQYTKQPVRHTLRLHPIRCRQILLIIAFSLLIQPFLMFLSYLSSLAFHNFLDDSLSTTLQTPYLILLLTMAVFPALFEEITCRGIFLSGYRGVNLYTAALLNGLYFGMLHMNMQQFVYAFVFGFLCSLLVIGADSIWASVLAHFIINGVQVTLAYFTAHLQSSLSVSVSTSQNSASVLSSVFLTVITLPLALACLRGIFSLNGRLGLLHGKREDNIPAFRKDPLSPSPVEAPPISALRGSMKPYYFAVVIFIVMCILTEFSK
jgi:CAAX amino terminal protease